MKPPSTLAASAAQPRSVEEVETLAQEERVYFYRQTRAGGVTAIISNDLEGIAARLKKHP